MGLPAKLLPCLRWYKARSRSLFVKAEQRQKPNL